MFEIATSTDKVSEMCMLIGIGADVPRYFIHIDELDTDPEGTELPDLDAALREARLAAREMLAASIKQGRDDVPLLFFIADEAGRVLKTVHITEALPKMLLNGKNTHI